MDAWAQAIIFFLFCSICVVPVNTNRWAPEFGVTTKNLWNTEHHCLEIFSSVFSRVWGVSMGPTPLSHVPLSVFPLSSHIPFCHSSISLCSHFSLISFTLVHCQNIHHQHPKFLQQTSFWTHYHLPCLTTISAIVFV